MALEAASLGARRRLMELGARYHDAGWLLGTSGNLSARFASADGTRRVVITASGLDKGRIPEDGFVELDVSSGEVVGRGDPGRQPSAETCIHLEIYRGAPTAAAVLHVHTVASTLAGLGSAPATLDLSGLEMVKGWGLWEPEASAALAVFANHAHLPAIAADVSAWLESPRRVPALLIAGHGLTAWGESLDAAHRHVEITEFLCRVHLERLRHG